MSRAALKKVAQSKSVARKIAEQVSPAELNKAIRNLQEAKQYLDKQIVKKRAAQKAQQVRKAISLLDKMGLKPEDLATLKKKSKKSKNHSVASRKVAAKYRITVKGVVTEWSGRGRMPVVFREALEKTGSLDRFLIN